MSRRGVLAALLVAGACAASPTFTVRHGAARAPPPPPAASAPALRVAHIGDLGAATRQQRAVVGALEDAHRRVPFDLVLDAGDLVYDCGPDATLPGADACAFAADERTVAPGFAPPPDPSFAVHDGPLAFLGATPVYVALGNHDVATGGRCGPRDDAVARRKACLSVAHAGPQWVMPGRHYAVDVGPARFIVLDTNVVPRDYGGFTLDGEVAFLAEQAAGCRERLCFVLAHHPPAAAGVHVVDFNPRFVERMQRLVDAGAGVRAWLAGHDHDLQHLRTRAGLDVLVSGNGARGRPTERFEAPAAGALLFGSVRWGYGVLEIPEDGRGWRYRFEDVAGEPVYCCAAAAAGPCEPVACR